MKRNSTLDGYLFLTGSTGLLGRYLIHDLMERGQKLALLVRSSKSESASERIEGILQYWEERTGKKLPRPVIIEGDIRQRYLGLSADAIRWVSEHCSALMHSAASLKFHADGTGEPRISNFNGSENMLSLCEAANIRDLHYVSTAYVCGLRNEVVMESDLNCGQSFRNDYEESKWEAENLVRSAKFLDKLTVYRPAVISGDSETGYTNTYHGIYLYLRLMALLVPRQPIGPDGRRQTDLRLPMTGDERRNVVPIDWVSKVIAKLYSTPEAHCQTFHLAPDVCLTPRQIIDAGYSYFNSTGIQYIGYQEIDPNSYNAFESEMLPGLTMYSNYAATDPTFDCSNVKRFAPELPCPIIDETMLHTYIRYGEEDKWGKRRATRAKVKHWASDYFKHFQSAVHDTRAVARIGFDISGVGGGQWTLSLDDQRNLTVSTGISSLADSVLKLTIDEFIRMLPPPDKHRNQHAIDQFFPFSFHGESEDHRSVSRVGELAG